MRWRPKKNAGLVPNLGLNFAAQLFTWMETFLVIRTKKGTLEPFRMNTIQQIMAQYVAHCWYEGIPVKVVLPKSRQMGSSTFWQALFFSMCELKEGYAVATVAHDEKGSTTIFGKSLTFARNLERTGWDKPAFVTEQASYLKWHSESSLHCGTIKSGDALGKGDTLSAIHYSESANFSDKGVNAKNAVASIQESCHDDRWTIYVHESTAKGKDPFYWPLCEQARDPSSGSTFRLIFLPWFLEKNYRLSWRAFRRQQLLLGNTDPGERFVATAEEEALRERLRTAEVLPHQSYWRYQFELSDSQLIWRRAKITEMGDPDLFKRYYPSFYEEAFTASASGWVNEETIDHYRKASRQPKVRGYFDRLTGRFKKLDTGNVRIWEQPDPLSEYVIGADIGGEKEGSDPSCAYVIDKHSYEVVAQVHGFMQWDHYADTLMALGNYYRGALLVVENNVNPAVAIRCHRANYVNLYYYQNVDRARTARPNDPGFNTNRKTRPAMLKLLKKHLKAHSVKNPDPYFWQEIENMVWVPTNTTNPDRDGVYKATGGNHDDRIMALAIAVYQCPQLEFTYGEAAIAPEEMSPAYLLHLRLKEEDRRNGARYGGYLNLGANRAAA